jgi:general secretion pathway protein C
MRDPAKQYVVLLVGVALVGVMLANLARAVLELVLVPVTPGGCAPVAAAVAPSPVEETRKRISDEAVSRLSQLASAAADIDAPCADLALIGVVSAASAEGSLAIFRLPGGRTALLRPGARVHELLLLEVHGGAALMSRSDGMVCSMHAYAGAQPRPRPRPASPNVFELDRALRDRVLDAPLAFMAGARVTLAPSGGFTVRGIRPGDLLDRLGVRNGDELLSINGFDLALPNGLEVWARLRTAEHLAVSIRRAGRPMQLDVDVR